MEESFALCHSSDATADLVYNEVLSKKFWILLVVGAYGFLEYGVLYSAICSVYVTGILRAAVLALEILIVVGLLSVIKKVRQRFFASTPLSSVGSLQIIGIHIGCLSFNLKMVSPAPRTF